MTQSLNSISFLQLIQPAPRRGETFVLNQCLVHDPAEVGAVASVALALHGVGDFGDLHRLAGFQHAFDHLHQALLVADASAARAAAAPVTVPSACAPAPPPPPPPPPCPSRPPPPPPLPPLPPSARMRSSICWSLRAILLRS